MNSGGEPFSRKTHFAPADEAGTLSCAPHQQAMGDGRLLL